MKLMNTFKIAACAGLMTLSSAAWAIPTTYTIGGGTTDIGMVDTYIDSDNLGASSEAQEAAWVSGVLGFSVTFADKTEFSGGEWVTADGNADIIAFDLINNDPAYYLVKFGGGKNASYDTHFLFQNEDNLNYAVLDLGAAYLADVAHVSISRISHLTEFGSTDVPEPSTLLLLGAGLAGVAYTRRRKQQK